MTRFSFPIPLVLSAVVLLAQTTFAQMSTAPAKPEELEAVYTKAIESRTKDILDALGLKEAEKASRVHDAIVAQYRALRARDAVVDETLKSKGEDTSYQNPARGPLVQPISRQLHTLFLETLSAYLTPEQVEVVKDKMTYNKVQVTYDAYCAIVPNLSITEKAKILAVLKDAREEAIDGGSAPEKHAIFDKYKKDIDDYLDAHGHDVAKAFKEWQAKQNLADKASENSPTKQN